MSRAHPSAGMRFIGFIEQCLLLYWTDDIESYTGCEQDSTETYESSQGRPMFKIGHNQADDKTIFNVFDSFILFQML